VNQTTKTILAAVLCVLALLLTLRAFFWGGGSGDASSADARKRLAGVESLRGREDNAARQRLVALADDPDRRVAFQAVKAMGVNRDEETYQALLQIAKEAQDPQVRGAAYSSLGQYDQTNLDLLTGALQDEKEPLARAGAARGLAHKLEMNRQQGRAAIPDLYRALYDPDPAVRGWAITAICKVTITRFNYSATTPPEAQRDRLKFIEDYLKRNGFM
jgi:HEAT repeat protein